MFDWEIITGLLRRYMNARIGNGFVNEAFSVGNGDAERVQRLTYAVRLFDAVQERVFA